MYFLQKIYSFALNLVYKFTRNMDERIKNLLFLLSCTGLIGFFVVFFMPKFWKYGIKNRLTLDTAICSAFLLLIIVISISGDLKPVKWNKYVFWLFFLSGAGVVAISFLHPIGSGYRAWGMVMMFGFPCLYYVWNNRRDYDELYKRLSGATIFVGIVYYIYCFYRAWNGRLRVIDDRVAGAFADSNMYSMIGMIMAICALYMLMVNRKSKWWFSLTAIGFGIGTALVFQGESRLSILAVAGSLVSFYIYYLKNRKIYCVNTSFVRRIARVVILLVSLIVFLFAGKIMIAINSNAVSEQNVIKTAGLESYTIIAEESSSEEDAFDRFNPAGHDMNSYTAGRFNIWKNYYQFLNWTGNDYSKSDWQALTGDTVKHAHNNFLEIGYRCGVPVAILHTLLELVAGIICIIYLFSKKYKEPEYLFSIMFMITYAIESLFDIATLPFERPAPFFFYMAMIPIFTFGVENEMAWKPKHLKR